MTATAQENEQKGTGRDQGRVLLVSDEPAPEACRAALEGAGLSVVGVTGGAAAMVALSRSRPHLVVADARLRGITAQELARALAQTQDGMPLLLVGEDESTLARRRAALSSGAFDYFRLPAEVELFVARSNQLVALRQATDRLRAEADRDYLTGLANRRRFRTALGNEVERWRRYNVPCALVLVDIDHLKKINDAFGHSAGDTVIRHVASVLTECSRDNDTAARLGGEEFALLLAGADAARARAAAERLRQDVCAHAIEGIGTATISLGVAACPEHADSERALYAACDALLYRAKRGGRNRAAVAGDDV
ncbi:MAG TPA: diguanylate cyclase [Pyrinomonadaceae bacterium]|jgi:diguanylate cyclase (GGDEF)-like protein|nr:diguanylate cyclase [Pyrinomonadaceae bacterium]